MTRKTRHSPLYKILEIYEILEKTDSLIVLHILQTAYLHLNSADYNECLKSIFRIVGLSRKIIQYNHETGKEETLILHEIASSHLARRTFVDILCQAGEPIHVVASMSGHSERSRAFDRYRQRPEQLQKEVVSRSMD